MTTGCPDGGIGRRAGLKHLWSQGRAGSTPALGTKPRYYGIGALLFLIAPQGYVVSTLSLYNYCCNSILISHRSIIFQP